MKLEPIFELAGVRFAYDKDAAGSRTYDIQIDDLRINRGDLIVFNGGNGAGKTTLLKLLNGLIDPDEGSIVFLGNPIESCRYAGIREKSVLVHQQPYLFSGSVYANVGYGLKIRKKDSRTIRSTVLESLAMVGLTDYAGHRARALSGGEQQRVAIARALVLEPCVLMLDEPTAHMDSGSSRRLEAVLRELNRQGTTLILCSHQQDFAYRLANRIEVMENGSINPRRENIYKGNATRRDTRFLYFRIDGSSDGVLRCPDERGDFSTAVLSADDIMLSHKEIETSAQNRFHGRVTATEKKDSLVLVMLDCGFPVQACITDYSCTQLKIQPGSELAVTFKASAVRLY